MFATLPEFVDYNCKVRAAWRMYPVIIGAFPFFVSLDLLSLPVGFFVFQHVLTYLVC